MDILFFIHVTDITDEYNSCEYTLEGNQTHNNFPTSEIHARTNFQIIFDKTLTFEHKNMNIKKNQVQNNTRIANRLVPITILLKSIRIYLYSTHWPLRHTGTVYVSSSHYIFDPILLFTRDL